MNGHYRCGWRDCAAEDDSHHAIDSAPTCDHKTQGDSEQRIIAALPHCVESIKENRCTTKCLQALRQFGLLGNNSTAASKRPKQVCGCRGKIIASPISITLKSIGLDPAEILRLCGLAGTNPASSSSTTSCDNSDAAIWAAGGQAQFLNQQGACGGESVRGAKRQAEKARLRCV